MAFGTQTDEIFVNEPQFREEFHGFYVMHMSGFHPPAIPFAFPAAVSVSAKDLHTLSMHWMIPPRIVVIKLHRQNKKRP